MYAVIKAGGKQQKVKAGDVIEVEYMHGVEDAVTFHPLLVVDDDGVTHVGKQLGKAVVTAKAAGEQKGDKVRVFKYKNKTGYSRKAGHRQLMTLLEISEVSLGGASGGSKPAPARKTAEEPTPEATEPEAEVPGE
jgi:large subunit ribosomal protein L21